MKRLEEKLLIESCVVKSAQIIDMKKAKQSIVRAKTLTTCCAPVFPHESCLINLINDIDNKICEYKLHISTILNPLLSAYGIIIDQKYWFTEQEIRQGFAPFQNSIIESGYSIILFLRDVIDPITNKLYPIGYVIESKYIKPTTLRELETNIISQSTMSLKECLKLWYV